jgi:hypothetical protein
MRTKRLLGAASATTWIVIAALAPVSGVGPSFRPDTRFTGTTLSGWTVVGDASWRAENGEIIGTPKSATGGWLMLNRSFQDVGFYARFRCTGGCQTGVLFRAEKTAQGMKGVFVSLTGGDVATERVTIDPQGRFLQRDALRPGGGQTRIAPPPDPNVPARGGGGGRGRGAAPTVKPPLQPPDTTIKAGEWNDVEVLLDANILRPFINNGGERAAGVADDEFGRFGPIALYVGGTGEVRFADLAYKDLAIQTRVKEALSSRYRLQKLTDFYYAWGAGAADFDHDGVMDVVAGPHVFFGPDYMRRREIYVQIATNPSNEYTRDCWMQFVDDFTGDGWADVITASFSGDPGVWLYVNPKGESRRWDKHLVVEAFNTEIAVLRDIDADGKAELVYGGQGQMRYAKPDPANPTGRWTIRNVSEPGLSIAHGVGVGDINGDKRMDVVNPNGWWEQPEQSKGESPQSNVESRTWTYHPQAFGRYGRNIVGGSVMAVYDVNGDGRNDVVTVLNPHGWGMAWYEQKRDTQGAISFEQHMIMDDHWSKNAGGVAFSQPHGTNHADMDGDGIQDFVVGKRYWSHRDTYLDPDPYGPAVLYVYRTVRNAKAPGGAEFVPELVHNHSGVGSDVLPFDLNRDGRMDIVTATRFGTFIFWGQASRR